MTSGCSLLPATLAEPLGAAQFVWYQLLNNPRQTTSMDSQAGSLLGPAFIDEQITTILTKAGTKFQHFDREQSLMECVAQLLADEKVVGWFQGRMEYGPRALGCRSILGDARSPKMQSVMNVKIKYRESFRPFAPIVLRETASEWFKIHPQHESPYMLIVADVADGRRTQLSQDQLMSQSADLCASTCHDQKFRLSRMSTIRLDCKPSITSAIHDYIVF